MSLRLRWFEDSSDGHSPPPPPPQFPSPHPCSLFFHKMFYILCRLWCCSWMCCLESFSQNVLHTVQTLVAAAECVVLKVFHKMFYILCRLWLLQLNVLSWKFFTKCSTYCADFGCCSWMCCLESFSQNVLHTVQTLVAAAETFCMLFATRFVCSGMSCLFPRLDLVLAFYRLHSIRKVDAMWLLKRVKLQCVFIMHVAPAVA